MSRNYGSLNRRAGGAVWQWIIIGAILGFGCSAIVLLGGLAAGVFTLDGQSVANLPTQTPFIITATSLPASATLPPTATRETTEVPLEVNAPTASPTLLPTVLTLQASSTPTTGAANPTGSLGASSTQIAQAGGQPSGAQNVQGGSFSSLVSFASEMVPVAGSTGFVMGTTQTEALAAVAECEDGYGATAGTCILADTEDSLQQHNIPISAFYMEVTEVTYEQYLRFLNTMGPRSHLNGCSGFYCARTRLETEASDMGFDSNSYSVNAAIANNPVANVSWYGAQAYCEAIGRRLPTEAEWERAARGDDGRIYPWGGSQWDATRASTNRPSTGGTTGFAVPVNSFPTGASPYGLLNMAGNVQEWVQDWYAPNWYRQPEASLPDTEGPVVGTEKVTRGGGWDTVPFFARTVHRRNVDPLDSSAAIGFRCASDTANPIVPSDELIGGAPQLTNPGTVDPAALGIIPGIGDEETTANDTGDAAPTLRPANTSTPAPTLAPTTAGTLAPG